MLKPSKRLREALERFVTIVEIRYEAIHTGDAEWAMAVLQDINMDREKHSAHTVIMEELGIKDSQQAAEEACCLVGKEWLAEYAK